MAAGDTLSEVMFVPNRRAMSLGAALFFQIQFGDFVPVGPGGIVKGKQMRVAGDVDDAVGHDRRRIDRRAQVHLADDFLFLARGQHGKITVLVADVHFAIGGQRRSPGVGLQVVGPIDLARFGIQTMKEAGEIADEEQSVGGDRHRRNAAMDLVVLPNRAGLGDVAGPRRVDAAQDADAFAMLGVLAGRDIDPIFPEDRRGIDFARPFRRWILDRLAVLDFVFGRIAIVLPDRFEEAAVGFFDGFGVEGVAPAIAATEEDQLPAVDFAGRGRTPLAVKDAGADFGVLLAQVFAGFFVERDETGRIGRRNVGVGPVLAVAGAGVKDVVNDEERAVGGVVREDAEFVHHVVAPNDVGILRAGFDPGFAGTGDVWRLVLERAVVAVGHALGIQTEDFAAAAHQVNPVALDRGRGEQAQALPIVDLA